MHTVYISSLKRLKNMCLGIGPGSLDHRLRPWPAVLLNVGLTLKLLCRYIRLLIIIIIIIIVINWHFQSGLNSWHCCKDHCSGGDTITVKRKCHLVKQFHCSGVTSKSWACSWTQPSTKLLSHRLAGHSIHLHQQQEKRYLQLLTGGK